MKMSEKIAAEKCISPKIRLNYLDWMRVLAMGTIFFYHSLRFFTIEDWHVKNPVTYLPIENLGNYLESWMMPLIFVISGASLFLAARKNKPALRFIWEKVLRLLVPLLVGIFTYSILQVYLEGYSHGDFSGAFWAFISGSVIRIQYNFSACHLVAEKRRGRADPDQIGELFGRSGNNLPHGISYHLIVEAAQSA
jgi:peptidoglycan/LPS O-acetylase OafA/YrhL